MDKPIQKYSIGYNILRAYVTFYLRMFYKKTTVIGTENIPDDKPVIIVINHQNALMDALTVLSVIKRQPVFMARADIFKSPMAAKFLRWIKILPIYRIRDGVKSLQNNEAIFEEAIGVLHDKKVLGILPEGSHGDQKRLRILKKGIARIAFKAEERKDFSLDIQIIPVGVDYTHYINFGGKLLINFGKPFNLSAYKEAYEENEQKGMNAFMVDLRERLLPQMLHVNDSENYDGLKALLDCYMLDQEKNHNLKANHLDEVKLQQKVSDQLIELKGSNIDSYSAYIEKGKKLAETVIKLNLRTWVLAKEKYSFAMILLARFFQLLLFPAYLYGFITNILQFQIPVYLSRGVKDTQFLSSMRFGLALVTFTLLYFIYFIILLAFSPSFLIALAISATIPLAGILSFKYYRWFKKTSAKFRNNKLRRKNNSDWIEMRKYYEDIVTFVNNTYKNN